MKKTENKNANQKNQSAQKCIHIIGICGVATSALAIAFHKKGWIVTGSDKGFYPPVSTALEQAGIPFYAGWHPEKMAAMSTSNKSGDDAKPTLPDFVVIGTASGTQNPETVFAHEHNIPIKSDAEVRGEYFAKKHSIVCAGTWGKTSSTALLAHILSEAGMDPSYVIGGLPTSASADLDQPFPAARLGDSEWSVIEGDEYKSSPTDNRPKFAYLHATHLLLTAVSWDHADLYPTEASYFKVFEKLIAEIPAGGLIIACNDHVKVMEMMKKSRANTKSTVRPAPWISYGKKNASQKQTADYVYENISQSTDGLRFTITHKDKKKDGQENSYDITSPMIGVYQAENITGCFALACEIGIPPKKVAQAISSFKGLKRRLEKRLDEEMPGSHSITIFDDIAHSPEKAASVLANVRSIYRGKIIAVFEPNIGGRQKEAVAKYDSAFKDADLVIIPRLTKLKINQDADAHAAAEKQPLEGDELAASISKTHPHVEYIDNDKTLVEKIVATAQAGDVIVFLGSHGFRGMIEETIQKLEK
jgi:UDP-N-acetylmuramate: L-alanyl-gamma-D-glutamyl-meso-diaminopimelate ligase